MCLFIWHLSLSIKCLRFTDAVVHINSSCLFIVEQYSIRCMCHKLCLHPPVDRHLGCFQVWVVINKITMNIQSNVFGLVLSFVSGKWLDHSINVQLLKKLPNCFQKCLHHFILLPTEYESSRPSLSLSTLGVVSLFTFSHSRYLVSHGGFNLYFPNDW